jgi:AcrR family transcriptional regulator
MGRTRSASAHRKVLDSAIQLVSTRGVDATSMDAIAAHSGVSKATVYKHWAGKDLLLLEMMAEIHGLHSRPTFDTGDTKADMIAVLAHRPQENAELRDRIMPHFMAYSAGNQTFGLAWRNMVMEPPRKELTRLIQSGIQRGELSPAINLDLALSMLLGPMVYWYAFSRKTRTDPKALAAFVVDTFWRAFEIPRIPPIQPLPPVSVTGSPQRQNSARKLSKDF